jgi:hypothetical protein
MTIHAWSRRLIWIKKQSNTGNTFGMNAVSSFCDRNDHVSLPWICLKYCETWPSRTSISRGIMLINNEPTGPDLAPLWTTRQQNISRHHPFWSWIKEFLNLNVLLLWSVTCLWFISDFIKEILLVLLMFSKYHSVSLLICLLFDVGYSFSKSFADYF